MVSKSFGKNSGGISRISARIDLIFGLEFGLREDSEHGRGLKFSLDSFEILEYGLGEVAYY